MSGMSPDGEGPTKAPKKTFAWIRKPFQEVITEYVPETKLIEQTVMVPVTKMVETVTMVPKYSYNTRYEFVAMDANDLYQGCPVKLYNVDDAPEMNGQSGVLDTYDPGRQEWTVTLVSSGIKVTVKADSIIVEQEGEEILQPPVALSGPPCFPGMAPFPGFSPCSSMQSGMLQATPQSTIMTGGYGSPLPGTSKVLMSSTEMQYPYRVEPSCIGLNAFQMQGDLMTMMQKLIGEIAELERASAQLPSMGEYNEIKIMMEMKIKEKQAKLFEMKAQAKA